MPPFTSLAAILIVLAASPLAHAAERLPDGGVARFKTGGIRSAWYSSPTDRYDHGVLGDAIEGGGLTVRLADGRTAELLLPQTEVFEDITPRLADLDGDGSAEVIAILSSLQKGGALAVYGVRDGKPALLAKTPFIGQKHRWLNIAGIADYDGDGRPEIALVKTPHIGGKLQFWRFAGSGLKRIASAQGFSNHFIGSRVQNLSATLDANGDARPDLAVPSADRTKLRVMTLQGGNLKELKTIDLGAPVSGNITLAGGTKLGVPVKGGKRIVDAAAR
jgi:FG-GAP-like repeat